ncbi:MAG: alpha/beta hydrolase [Crocinitomicaceae bacterium]|nr:alpha/beta hydrolase [Crocinitomicaceae bacterium]
MKMLLYPIVLFGLLCTGCSYQEQATEPFTVQEMDETNKITDSTEQTEQPAHVEFASLDGLTISANIYEVDKDAPVIVLCHQAGFNKHEYDGIAEKLNAKGFNCIAIDQRSGGLLDDHQNETTLRAVAQGKPIEYLDAEQDIIAAINYASEKYNRPVTLWGSSYSATLVLYLAVEKKNVNAVISFSPGDYFSNEKGSLVEKLADFNKPLFITSSKQEASGTKKLMAKMKMNDSQTQFIPEGTGHHGSRALWENQTGGEEYWTAIDVFLAQLKAH